MAMPEARLAAGLWVEAYLRQLQLEGIPAFVTRRGDATAGAVLVKTASMDGTATAHQRVTDPMTGTRRWEVLAAGPEADVDATITRQRGFDPDLWVIEIEDPKGRNLLDRPGLAD